MSVRRGEAIRASAYFIFSFVVYSGFSSNNAFRLKFLIFLLDYSIIIPWQVWEKYVIVGEFCVCRPKLPDE